MPNIKIEGDLSPEDVESVMSLLDDNRLRMSCGAAITEIILDTDDEERRVLEFLQKNEYEILE